MSVEIFPFLLFGAIATVAVVGIFAFRLRPEQRSDHIDRTIERRRRTMKTVRDACWVALVIAVLGAIAYLVLPG